MGYYGHNKARQMGRSILPCSGKSRKYIKDDLNARRRNNRRVARQMLHNYDGGIEASEAIELFDELGEPVDFWWEVHGGPNPHGAYSEDIVQERRDRDKVQPIMRWADRVTKDMDPQDRVDHIRGVLPGGLIGDHAMSHIEMVIGYDPIYDGPRFARRGVAQAERRRERERVLAEFNEAFEAALSEVAHNDKARNQLNKMLIAQNKGVSARIPDHDCRYGCGCRIGERYRYTTPYDRYINVACDQVRIMHGYHDRFKFERDIRAGRTSDCEDFGHRHRDWFETLCEFLGVDMP